jgi:hypothetical protein
MAGCQDEMLWRTWSLLHMLPVGRQWQLKVVVQMWRPEQVYL